MDDNGIDDDDNDEKSRWQVIIKEQGLAWLMPVSACVVGKMMLLGCQETTQGETGQL